MLILHFRYYAMVIMCPLQNMPWRPATVGIQVGNMRPTNVSIIYPCLRQHKFTVSIHALHGPFTNYMDLIEMVELDTMFGADHFVVYNHSVSPEVDRVLRYYISIGRMEVLPWNLPNVTIHYYGQLAQLQDCHLSARQKTKYLVLKDVDEFIVPRKYKNWHELMEHLDTGKSKVAAYLFRNNFFNMNWNRSGLPFTGDSLAEMLQLKSLLYTTREKGFWPRLKRTKSIVLPELIASPGIHFPWAVKKGYEVKNVSAEEAFVHHYRYFVDVEKAREEDSFMRQYADHLIHSTMGVMDTLGYYIVNGTYRLSLP